MHSLCILCAAPPCCSPNSPSLSCWAGWVGSCWANPAGKALLGAHLCLHSSGCSAQLGPAWHGGSLGSILLMEIVDAPSAGVFKPGWMGL